MNLLKLRKTRKKKKAKKNGLLLKVFLSAISFNLAFFFSDLLGFFIILSFLLLFYNFYINYKNCLQSFLYGFIWGVGVFFVHFIYLLETLLNKSGASLFIAYALYFTIALYFSILSAICFLFVQVICSYFKEKLIFNFAVFSFFISSFFLFLEKYCFFFLGESEGYPFLNPFIPLVNYRWFLFFISILCNGSINNNFRMEKEGVYKVFHLKPVRSFFCNKKNNLPAHKLAKLINKELRSLNLKKIEKNYKNLIIVAPETFFPFCLNIYPEVINLWKYSLPENTHFFLGSQRLKESKEGANKIFQTVYWIHRGRIIGSYDKTHRAIFAEKTPLNCKREGWSKSLFLQNGAEFHQGKKENVAFKLDCLNIIPQICSEFFVNQQGRRSSVISKFNRTKDDTVIFFFVNDSWFMPYFKKTMKNLALLRTSFVNTKLCYINHSK